VASSLAFRKTVHTAHRSHGTHLCQLYNTCGPPLNSLDLNKLTVKFEKKCYVDMSELLYKLMSGWPGTKHHSQLN